MAKSRTVIAFTRDLLASVLRKKRDYNISYSEDFKLKGSDIITPTLVGNATKSAIFYESDKDKIYRYYYSYIGTKEFYDDIQYTDIVSIKSPEWEKISERFLDVGSIIIRVHPNKYRIPNKLKMHHAFAVETFKMIDKLNIINGIYENNYTINLFDITEDGVFHAKNARYTDQIATNITIDWQSPYLPSGASTIRLSIERHHNGSLPPLRDSMLANTIGVAAMVYSRKLMPLIRIRNNKMAAINVGSMHCTVSGALDVEAELDAGDYNFSLFERGIRSEIRNETGLEDGEYILAPVVYARELPRGGKPQIIFVAISTVDDELIRIRMEDATESAEYIPAQDGSQYIEKIYEEANSDFFTYEGWAVFYYADHFIEANKKKILENINHIKTSP